MAKRNRVEEIKEEIKEEIEEEIEEEKWIVEYPVDFITTGSTVLNLAASQKGADGGWARGRIVNIVGGGSSGKTLLALEAAARCFPQNDIITGEYYPGMLGNISHNFPEVRNVEICYNNVEGVMDFPIENMYGTEFGKMVRSGKRTSTVQGFGRHFLKKVRDMKSGDFLLYIVDSWDALDSEDEYEEFIKSIEKDKPLDGSYDLGKQKYGSKRFFKTLCDLIEGDDGKVKKDCTLFIISQVKQKIGVTFGEKTYRTGGDALNYFTHQVAWLREKDKISHIKNGQLITTGIDVHARLKRNKTALPFREAEFPILFNHGIDNITSMINFLYGPKSKEVTDLFGKNFKTYETIVKYVEENCLEDELVKMATDKWLTAEESGKPNRKRRFPN